MGSRIDRTVLPAPVCGVAILRRSILLIVTLCMAFAHDLASLSGAPIAVDAPVVSQDGNAQAAPGKRLDDVFTKTSWTGGPHFEEDDFIKRLEGIDDEIRLVCLYAAASPRTHLFTQLIASAVLNVSVEDYDHTTHNHRLQGIDVPMQALLTPMVTIDKTAGARTAAVVAAAAAETGKGKKGRRVAADAAKRIRYGALRIAIGQPPASEHSAYAYLPHVVIPDSNCRLASLTKTEYFGPAPKAPHFKIIPRSLQLQTQPLCRERLMSVQVQSGILMPLEQAHSASKMAHHAGLSAENGVFAPFGLGDVFPGPLAVVYIEVPPTQPQGHVPKRFQKKAAATPRPDGAIDRIALPPVKPDSGPSFYWMLDVTAPFKNDTRDRTKLASAWDQLPTFEEDIQAMRELSQEGFDSVFTPLNDFLWGPTGGLLEQPNPSAKPAEPGVVQDHVHGPNTVSNGRELLASLRTTQGLIQQALVDGFGVDPAKFEL